MTHSRIRHCSGIRHCSRIRHCAGQSHYAQGIEMMKKGYIYIVTNKNNTTLYVGVTSNLKQRIEQHKEKLDKKSFTARYNLNKLVYYETFQMIGDAIGREKQLKGGNRATKIALIESMNPNWEDLYDGLN